MKMVVITTDSDERIEVAIEENKIHKLANLIENSDAAKEFYVDGLNVVDQQKLYGRDRYTKWKSPIQQ